MKITRGNLGDPLICNSNAVFTSECNLLSCVIHEPGLRDGPFARVSVAKLNFFRAS